MDPREFRWPAPAKINLMLHILGVRDDGYHLLETRFQFIEWLDWLSFEPTQGSHMTRTAEIPGVPAELDLTLRAAELLRKSAGIAESSCIRLEKSVPMGAGLGGGSSDAATALVALNEIWRAGLSVDELAEIGLSLGADVPVFIRGEAAFATGIGEKLTQLDAPEGPILVIYPACHVETKAVFTHAQLTRDTPSIKIPDLVAIPSRNDCESVTRLLYPEVGEALDWLGQYADARMSGTGASVFAVFDTLAAADKVARLVPERWTRRVTRRLNRSPLLEARRQYREMCG